MSSIQGRAARREEFERRVLANTRHKRCGRMAWWRRHMDSLAETTWLEFWTRARLRAITPKPCSCSSCGNPRANPWRSKHNLTRMRPHEVRSLLSYADQLEDLDERLLKRPPAHYGNYMHRHYKWHNRRHSQYKPTI